MTNSQIINIIKKGGDSFKEWNRAIKSFIVEAVLN